MQTQFRLELAQERFQKNKTSFAYTIPQTNMPILVIIAYWLNTAIYSRSKKMQKKTFYSYILVVHNIRSKLILRDYLDKFPLYSSKYLDYKNWCKTIDISAPKYSPKNTFLPLSINQIESCKSLKLQMNSNRKIFNWDHLQNFPF